MPDRANTTGPVGQSASQDALSAPTAPQEATIWPEDAPGCFRPLPAVPTELEVEYERRVQSLLALWERIYASAGTTAASPVMDRWLAEERVGREMGLR